ncbi:MAG: hypothetical protein H7Z14_11910 [Anaerolineae bacterium]|nr:hypothetical protein [Phycisphaerae bacterium]
MIPVVEDLKSSPMTHRFGDLFCPPGLTNFLGCVQSDLDPVAIRSLNFPPFACSDTVTGTLFLNGKIFAATGSPVTTTWLPDRIERVGEADGLRVSSTTVLVVKQMAAIVRVEVKNLSTSPREVTIKLGLRGGVTKSVTAWNNAHPPTETDNAIEIDSERRAIRFRARASTAVCLQGVVPPAIDVTNNGLRITFPLRPGESKVFSYLNVIADDAAGAASLYDQLARNPEAEIRRARDDWNAELAAVFTPGNDRYSGHMPTLETSDRDVLKLYHIGILGTIYFKRESPYSVHGRAYTTLIPRYWQPVTFLWDYSLSSLVHALLDPAEMRASLERWMKLDIHKHFGTEYLTGAGVGPWYSVNDFAMTSIARDYLRFSGDLGWLDRKVGEQKTVDYLEQYAHNYKRFATKSKLADYGGLNNLLECVNTYVHEVASLNAANVFNLRTVAEIISTKCQKDKAASMLAEAKELAREVNKLYVEGKGFFHARFPDGSLREVRHCYDFNTVLNTIPDDIPEKQKREMVDFFRRELQTPAWMHALSCDDDDAMFSVRPDHQWTGAYPAWPPQAVTGLYRIGEVDLAFDWVKGLARSANQGPFGQAHFCETVVDPEDGGAIKAPPDFPYITDWTCSSNGAWTNIIIESIFGVKATLANGISAEPKFGKFDPNAVLKNLNYQGKNYTVTKRGIEK